MPKLIDLTGQKFGRLTVLDKAPSRNGFVYWLCQCDCGTIKEIRGASLKSGKSQSCGCLKNEIVAEMGKASKGSHIIDITGQQYGDLTVLELIDQRGPYGHTIWKCQCSCGNICEVYSANLRQGKTTHCGCKNIISKGENKIRSILLENNIKFEQQKTFQNCKYPDTNTVARFDFWVDNRYIIEYDGEQHFLTSKNYGWMTEDKIKYTQKHDNYKNSWCKNNNIPIIHIPYTYYNEIKLKDLIPETSNFIL